MKVELEQNLIAGGDIVKSGAASKFSAIDPTEAAGYQTKLKGYGRVLVQGKRSKRRRGDFGALLMTRTLLPSLGENSVRVTKTLERMLDTLGREFN